MSDTTQIQGMIDAAVASGQRLVTIPAGTWVLDRGLNTSGGPCLTAPLGTTGLRIQGAGMGATVLTLAPGVPASSRTLYVNGPGTVVSDITFAGDPLSLSDEHAAGLFVQAPGFIGYNIEARGHVGDGIYLYSGASDCVLDRCLSTGNHRNGITFGGTMDGVSVINSQFLGNGAQQVDTEPGVGTIVSGLLLKRCRMDGQGISGDYVLTLGGAGPLSSSEGHDVAVIDCELNGGIYAVWGRNIVLDGCYGTNTTPHGTLSVWRSARNIEVVRCNFTTSTAYAVLITGTGDTSMPSNVSIEDSMITCTANDANGIVANAVDSLRVAGCTVRGNGVHSATHAYAIGARATTFARPGRRVEIAENRLESFGERGIILGGNVLADPTTGVRTFAHIQDVVIRGNSIGNGPGISSLTHGMVLDDGSLIANRMFLGPDNSFDASVTTPLTGIPSTCQTLV